MKPTFSQRPGKFNFEKLSQEHTTSVVNLFLKNPIFQSLGDKLIDIRNGLNGWYPGVVYGKPNSELRTLESSPGVWVFDFSNGVTILMFSDGFRKNHFKGTSYEVVLNKSKDNDILEALEVLFDDCIEKSKSMFPDEFSKLESLGKKLKR